MRRAHAMPFGAEIVPEGVRFRLWAPDAEAVTLEVEGVGDFPLPAGPQGWREAVVPGIGAGARYRYRIGDLPVPDPASRHQPEDVHGPSEVVDPAAYDWQDDDWRGRPWHEAVVYELHIGTFTAEGTFRAAIAKLDWLVELGITAIEVMPVAEFPGVRGWGYDGVLPFAPDAAYGRPEDFKALIDAAHAKGLMVLLDVVYNHFGPEGNYLHAYARRFFTDRHHTPWGQAINYDGTEARPVRDTVIHNALFWLEEYHLDGLRLDAVHAIVDDSVPDVLEELARTVRATITDRPIHLVLENDENSARLLAPGLFTAQWNDDIHHALHALLTGEFTGYYRDYVEPVCHLARCLAEGFAYQGEASLHRNGAPRGEPTNGLAPLSFVSFLQNHDQIGNRALGERIDRLAPPQAVRAATALLLLAPMPPMLFMGEEWGAATPFLYFCDFGPELARAVRQGRKREFAHFPQFQGIGARRIPDPNSHLTFHASKLDWSEPEHAPHAERLAETRRLLRLRRDEVAPRLAGIAAGCADSRVIGPAALQCNWTLGRRTLGDGARLTVVANFSPDPLSGVVPPPGRVLYSTGDFRGGLPPWGVIWTMDEGNEA